MFWARLPVREPPPVVTLWHAENSDVSLVPASVDVAVTPAPMPSPARGVLQLADARPEGTIGRLTWTKVVYVLPAPLAASAQVAFAKSSTKTECPLGPDTVPAAVPFATEEITGAGRLLLAPPRRWMPRKPPLPVSLSKIE